MVDGPFTKGLGRMTYVVARMTPAAAYHAFYMTLWRMNEAHDLRRAHPASNDNDPAHDPSEPKRGQPGGCITVPAHFFTGQRGSPSKGALTAPSVSNLLHATGVSQ
jgi:hypothetical protein